MDKTIIVYGNPVDGFTFIGPFDHADQAVKYARVHDDGDPWNTADLVAPASSSPCTGYEERAIACGYVRWEPAQSVTPPSTTEEWWYHRDRPDDDWFNTAKECLEFETVQRRRAAIERDTMRIKGILAHTETSLEAIQSYGYKLCTWEDFLVATDVPEGLLDRAYRVTDDSPEERRWVVYDPASDDEGWMLIGMRGSVIRLTAEHLADLEPPSGPLARLSTEDAVAAANTLSHEALLDAANEAKNFGRYD